MADFLELLEKIDVQKTSTRQLFEANTAEGRSIRTANSRRNPQYIQHLAEAVKFLGEVMNGYRKPWELQEVMTSSDFPQLFGDILDRSLLATYQEWPVSWTSYAKRAVVNDFRQAKLIPPVFGADTILDIVPEGDQYPEATLEEQTPILWSVNKYGRKVPLSWETLINDDLDQFREIPQALARASRRTEHRLVTAQFVGTSGPLGTLYHADYDNQIITANGAVTNNPALSVNGLQDAYTVLSKMVGENGEPIMREMLTLVVPPALEVTAKNILNAIEIETTQARMGGNPNASDSGENRLRIANWMRNSLRLVVDPYIPVIATVANGNTSWFLFANPGYSREAIRIGFLRGHEAPEIWMKSPNAVRVGGGDVGAMAGDFDTDSVVYRVRHVTGVVTVDQKATVASNGSGS